MEGPYTAVAKDGIIKNSASRQLLSYAPLSKIPGYATACNCHVIKLQHTRVCSNCSKTMCLWWCWWWLMFQRQNNLMYLAKVKAETSVLVEVEVEKIASMTMMAMAMAMTEQWFIILRGAHYRYLKKRSVYSLLGAIEAMLLTPTLTLKTLNPKP